MILNCNSITSYYVLRSWQGSFFNPKWPTSEFICFKGDRWWMFSMGLLLVTLSPVQGSLRVTAINSITISVGLILFSHVIGYWIDLSPRLNGTQPSSLHYLLPFPCPTKTDSTKSRDSDIF